MYNERDGISAVVRHWDAFLATLGVSYEIVIHNDGSSDGSLDVVRALESEIPCLRVIDGKVNRGYGHAMNSAIRQCRGKYIATIDSDGQFEIADLARFLPLLDKAGFVGVNGRRVAKKDSFAKVLADRCLNVLVRGMFGTRMVDTNCALKLIRADVLQSLRIDSSGYSYPTEVCLKIERKGMPLVEVDVTHREREGGMSSLTLWHTGTNFLIFLVYLRLRFVLHGLRFIDDV